MTATGYPGYFVKRGSDVKNAARYRLRHRYREDMGTRLTCFGRENKSGGHFTRYNNNNNNNRLFTLFAA